MKNKTLLGKVMPLTKPHVLVLLTVLSIAVHADDDTNIYYDAIFFNGFEQINLLNDTGTDFSGELTVGNDTQCEELSHELSDCKIGRDATHYDNTDGHAGFNFTKLDADGNDLPADALVWSCVRDNFTEMVWEVKTDDGGIHDQDKTYRWGGISHDGDSFGTYYDDWDELVIGSINEKLCGFTDWRVPSISEYVNLMDFGLSPALIDRNYFPYIGAGWYWTNTASQESGLDAFYIDFLQPSAGDIKDSPRYGLAAVRLVRVKR